MVSTPMDKNNASSAPGPPFDPEPLTRLSYDRLRRLHHEVFGHPAIASSADHLLRKIAWELQARAEGRLPDAARELALTIARGSVLRSRPLRPGSKEAGAQDGVAQRALTDPRLPRPGSCLVRNFGERRIVVKVLASGFEFDGSVFASLSAIARAVTGTRWNGFVFFGIHKDARHARKTR